MMNTSRSPSATPPNKKDFPASVDKLRQLIQDKVHFLQSLINKDQQGLESPVNTGADELRRLKVLCAELTFHLQELQRQTEQELQNIQTQLFHIENHRQLLSAELSDLQEKKKRIEQGFKRNCSPHTSTELQAAIVERVGQSDRLLFQEEALSTLRNLLTHDLQRYQEETQSLTCFTCTVLKQSHRSKVEETTTNTQTDSIIRKMEQGNNTHTPECCSSQSPFSRLPTVNGGKADSAWRASQKKPSTGVSRSTNLHRAGSVKDLIGKFSGPDHLRGLSIGAARDLKSASAEALASTESQSSPSTAGSLGQDVSVHGIAVTLPFGKSNQNGTETTQAGTQTSQIAARVDCPVEGTAEEAVSEPKSKAHSTDSNRNSAADSGMGSESECDSNKRPDSTSESPTMPKATSASQNPKYQLFLSNEVKTNGPSCTGPDGPGSSRRVGGNSPDQWKTTEPKQDHWTYSLPDLNGMGDFDDGNIDSPPRLFNSPYGSALSMEFRPYYRMSEYKPPVYSGIYPTNSEENMYSLLNRSPSPVGFATLPTRTRTSAYETLLKRRAEASNAVQASAQHNFFPTANVGLPNKIDYIEELTRQLEEYQRRNQFLEAEKVQMDKERSQIRFEMRSLLVKNEDLLRDKTQMTNELKRTREQQIEMERESQLMAERCRVMEIEVKEAREMMVEVNNQEYAFNFLQQSLRNKLQDAEENLEKQTLHVKELTEKLWLTERRLEELEVSKGSKDKKMSDLSSTVLRLESELAEAIQTSTQAATELSLQHKLRTDAQMRADELGDSLLEKGQELQKLRELVSRLQEEVSDKRSNSEQTLEEEIQLRERLQLQCKQAERTVDELQMELHRSNQARDDQAKQLKQAQEKLIDLETDVEELQESEKKWAAKQKRVIEQNEQLQLKLIQEKDRSEQLEFEKTSLERQLREARAELEDLQSSKVQDDVIYRMEGRIRELENMIKAEERSKAVLTNSISKLERKNNELSEQLEEEHRIAAEQKDLMSQRMRSLKRQLNEVEEEASRKEAQYRHTTRELAEERETSARLQRQLLDQHLQTKRKDTLTIRQTLDNLRLDLSVDDDEDHDSQLLPQQANVTKV